MRFDKYLEMMGCGEIAMNVVSEESWRTFKRKPKYRLTHTDTVSKIAIDAYRHCK